MANIIVTETSPVISVNSTSNVVTVTSAISNITVANVAAADPAAVRQSLSVTDAGGDGSLTYSNVTGVFTYTGPSAAEVRAHLSNTSPIEYSAVTGVISIDSDALFTGKDTDDLAEGSTNLYYTTARANSAILGYTGAMPDMTGNVTTTANVSAGNILGIVKGEVNSTSNITTTANVSGAYILGDGSALTNISHLTNAQVQTYIEANGLDIAEHVNVTTQGNIWSNAMIQIGPLSGDYPGNTAIDLQVNGNTSFHGNVTAGRKLTAYPNNWGTTTYLEAYRMKPRYLEVGGTHGSGISTSYIDFYGGSGGTSGERGEEIQLQVGSKASASENLFTVTSANANASFNGVVGLEVDFVANATTFPGQVITAGDANIGGDLILSGASISSAGALSVDSNVDFLAPATGQVYIQSSHIYMGKPIYDGGGGGNLNVYDGNIIVGRGTPTVTIDGTGGTLDAWGNVSAGNITTAHGTFTGATSLTATGNVSIGGNLNVTGNINSETVVDLLVEDRNITLQYGATGTPSANSQLFVDRGSSSNSYIIWSEADDKWGFSNDGSNVVFIATDTDGLVEGSTNLYFTTARANTSIGAYTGAATNLTGNITTTANVSGANFLGNVTGNLTGAPSSLAGLDTDDLAEGGTNLYWTTARGNTAIGAYTGNLTAVATTGNITTTANVSGGNILGVVRGEVDSTSNITTTANVSAGNVISTFIGDVTGNVTGNVSGSPSSLAGLDTDDLAEGTNLYYTDARVQTKAANLTGNITTTANIQAASALFTGAQVYLSGGNLTTATGNVDLGSQGGITTYQGNVTIGTSAQGYLSVRSDIESTTGNIIATQGDFLTYTNGRFLGNTLQCQPSGALLLEGQANSIRLDKTISSAESRIVDFDTTGYSVMSADFHTAAIVSDTVASLYTTLTATSGSPTLTAYNMTALPNYIYAIQEQGPATYTGYGAWGQPSLEAAIGAPLIGGNLSGWTLYQVGGSTISLFPAGAHVVSISGSTITMSENAIASATGGVILYPGAFTSHNTDIGFIVSRLNVGTVVDYAGIVPWWNSYATSETLANVTMDRVSYGDATADLANVVMRNIADLTVSNASAVRTPRAILVGESATPDLLSIGTTFVQPATSTLGVTVEQDGLTDFGDVETTPPLKFMFNNFMDNSLAGYTTYPLWAEFLGETGNATVDMPYLGAPSFNFKLGGGTKTATTGTSAGEIPGRITWNTSTGTLFTGVDQFNPPASITTMVGGTGVTTTMANVDMHFQSTYPTSYRSGIDATLGSIPRTFLSSSAGDTIIAAKHDGKITLRPVRDYGDTATTDSFIENRFAPNLHEYHEFLGAGFLTSSASQGSGVGTLVEIQPKSGSTNGSTADFNYDSKGDATLRLNTHEANSALKAAWDITNEQSSANLKVKTGSTVILDVASTRIGVEKSLRLVSLTTVEISALSGPVAGDTVYNETLAKLCFYNGSAWQQVTSTAMIP